MSLQLPALAFNEGSKNEIMDFNAYRAYRERANGGALDTQSLIQKDFFRIKESSLNINGLDLRARSHTPFRAERIKDNAANFWILSEGSTEGASKTGAFPYSSGHTAFLSARDGTYFTTGYASTVRIQFSEENLNRVIFAMSGGNLTKISLENSRLVSLHRNGISFSSMFQNLWKQIDSVGCDQRLLEILNFDDIILRLCVVAINSNPQFMNYNNQNWVRPQIQNLCEYLHGNLNKSISLTEMEEISGLSARVLQYSFQKSFGVRPKEWLRKQRLHAVRSILEKPDQQIKLTSLAYDFCFASPSNLAKHYKDEFGELPSQTVARKRSFILP